MPNESEVELVVNARVPTATGEFQLCLYHDGKDSQEHLALVMGVVRQAEGVLVRLHSECFTGDVLQSLRCDCGEQLRRSLELIAAEGAGVLVYLRQEGRGIGLRDKLLAYNLQDGGLDTVDANLALGHQADERDYSAAACILADLGVRSVRLMTNNPTKIEGLRALGVRIVDRVPLEADLRRNVEGLCALRRGSANIALPTPHGVREVNRLDAPIGVMEEETRLLKRIFESVTKLSVAHGAAS